MGSLEDFSRSKFLMNWDSVDSEIYNEFYNYDFAPVIQEILNSSPFISAIINNRLQIVLSNSKLNGFSSAPAIKEIIGQRPGKILSCHNNAVFTECGKGEKCKYCGILNTIKKSQHLNITVTGESRISVRRNNKLEYHDFKITCSPLQLNNRNYTLMHLEDISHEKRKAVLENVFFHDVLNRLGGLSGIINLLKHGNKQPELEEYLNILETIGDIVVEDIQNQQYLKSAENDNLLVNIRENKASEIVESVKRQIMFHPVANNIQVETQFNPEDFILQTDGVLLKRVLLNMAKNAAEAMSDHGRILISAVSKKKMCTFSVNNPGVIPIDIQHQIFQRSFSTKGQGRGLGTYSMKLFGETYLKGKVGFTTNTHTGTTFFIDIPVSY